MGSKIRYSISAICTVASVPGALLGLFGTVFVAADGCGARGSGYGCGGSLILAVLMLVALVFAWIGYFDLTASWVSNRKARREVVMGAPAAALSYILMAVWIARGPDWWTAIVATTLPVLPAVLLAAYLTCLVARPVNGSQAASSRQVGN
jgi:hypothetical protein